MRRLLASLSALLLVAGPAQAQESDPAAADMADFSELMQGLFAAEPLTADEESRLPRASAVVAKVMPEGIYARMMRETLDSVMTPLLSLAPQSMPPAEIAERVGVSADEVDTMEPEQLERIGAMLDPAYAQRQQVVIDYMLGRMVEVMAGMEPGVREGLSRAYARRFSEGELADIAAFFETPTGARYASESMLLFTDPQTMAGTMEAMPALMGMMPELMQGAEEAMAGLPAERGHADLSAAERADLAAALGLSDAALRDAMLAAERARADAVEDEDAF